VRFVPVMPAPRAEMKLALAELGRRVAAARRARGISQEELAWSVGIHTNHLSTIERGIANPSVAVVLAISGALGVDVADLMVGLETGKINPRRH
jgi:transcriptional regulator with XRE-family HTH domain